MGNEAGAHRTWLCVGVRRRVKSSNENGRKRMENPIFTSISIFFFWRKQDQVRKIRVLKRNGDMRMLGNKQIQMESRKIKLE
jgi:hypothetical protein